MKFPANQQRPLLIIVGAFSAVTEAGNDIVYCSDRHQYLKALSGADVRVNTFMALCVQLTGTVELFFVRSSEKSRARQPTTNEVAFLFRSLLLWKVAAAHFLCAARLVLISESMHCRPLICALHDKQTVKSMDGLPVVFQLPTFPEDPFWSSIPFREAVATLPLLAPDNGTFSLTDAKRSSGSRVRVIYWPVPRLNNLFNKLYCPSAITATSFISIQLDSICFCQGDANFAFFQHNIIDN